MPSFSRTLVLAALCISSAAAHEGHVHLPNCTALGGLTKDSEHAGHDVRLLHGDEDHGNTDGAVLLCPDLTQLFNVEDKYLSMASCTNATTFTYNACADEAATDCAEKSGSDFVTLLTTKSNEDNCYRMVCSSATEGQIAHFAGPCDDIEAAHEFDTYCDAHHACAAFDNSEVGGDAAAASTAAMALAATALVFASLM